MIVFLSYGLVTMRVLLVLWFTDIDCDARVVVYRGIESVA